MTGRQGRDFIGAKLALKRQWCIAEGDQIGQILGEQILIHLSLYTIASRIQEQVDHHLTKHYIQAFEVKNCCFIKWRRLGSHQRQECGPM